MSINDISTNPNELNRGILYDADIRYTKVCEDSHGHLPILGTSWLKWQTLESIPRQKTFKNLIDGFESLERGKLLSYRIQDTFYRVGRGIITTEDTTPLIMISKPSEAPIADKTQWIVNVNQLLFTSERYKTRAAKVNKFIPTCMGVVDKVIIHKTMPVFYKSVYIPLYLKFQEEKDTFLSTTAKSKGFLNFVMHDTLR